MLNTMIFMEENKPFEQKQNQELINKCNNKFRRISKILKKRYSIKIDIDDYCRLIFKKL